MFSHFLSRFLYKLLRKALHIQIKCIRKALSIFNKLRVNHDCPKLVIPFCVSTGFSNIYWQKSWKTELFGRLVDVREGVFIDVGANVGQTLIDVLVTHPKTHYVGFEPNVSCVFYLNELIQANSFTNCTVLPVGLADETQCLPLYRAKDLLDDSGATLISDLRPSGTYDSDYVSCFRFDEIRPILGIEKINFVKIDVEGSEFEALVGMRKSLLECRPVILCEVLFTDIKADIAQHRMRNERLIRLLGDLNYQVFQLHKSKDNRLVIDARKIQQFASEYWTVENKEFCDYLFVPAEKEVHVLNTLFPGKSLTESPTSDYTDARLDMA